METDEGGVGDAKSTELLRGSVGEGEEGRFEVLSPGQCAALQAFSALIALAEASAVTWSVAASAVVVLALGGAFGR
ncbi:hypothetical protein [Nocardia sp. bgisy134]|uniref:hypothetical protein n=1 Tax=Nocardia sp. bgisy134 TaxID=3413789 RepID=UPI003D75D330